MGFREGACGKVGDDFFDDVIARWTGKTEKHIAKMTHVYSERYKVSDALGADEVMKIE